MRRSSALVAAICTALCVMAASSGCRMCASPYDYCGPVVECDCCGDGGHSAENQESVPYYNGQLPGSNNTMPAQPNANLQRAPTPATMPQSR